MGTRSDASARSLKPDILFLICVPHDASGPARLPASSSFNTPHSGEIREPTVAAGGVDIFLSHHRRPPTRGAALTHVPRVSAQNPNVRRHRLCTESLVCNGGIFSGPYFGITKGWTWRLRCEMVGIPSLRVSRGLRCGTSPGGQQFLQRRFNNVDFKPCTGFVSLQLKQAY